MRQGITKWYPGFDSTLVTCALALLLIGLVMVTSASISVAEQKLHTPFYFTIRHSIYLLISIGAAIGVLYIPIKFWQRLGLSALIASILLLILVLIPGIGRVVNGSQRWLHLGGITLQVSELVKLGMIIYMSYFLLKHNEEIKTKITGFLKPLAVLAIISSLLLLEPDFGATVVIGSTTLGMMFLAGARLRQFVILTIFLGIATAVLAISSPYRMARLTSFLNPWADQFDSGYQLTQALIAFGRGKFFGLGLGNSIQKLFYLPEAHTDFLLAVIAEELGLFGVLGILTLFVMLVYRGFVIGRQAELAGNQYGALLAYGISLQIGIQALINIGVNSGLLPTKGLTLPLLSYGGSSILVVCVSLAMLLRVDYETRLTSWHKY